MLALRSAFRPWVQIELSPRLDGETVVHLLATGGNGGASGAEGHSTHGRLEARHDAIKRVLALFEIKEAYGMVLAARHQTLALSFQRGGGGSEARRDGRTRLLGL